MPKRILHVDDEADIRDVAAMALSLDPELEVTSAASGMEALSLIDKIHPDLILLDVMMPTMDGPATYAALRKRADMRTTPILFMTAKTSNGEVEKLTALGAAGIIAKPFDPMALARNIRAYL